MKINSDDDPRTGILATLHSQFCDLEIGNLVLIILDSDYGTQMVGMVASKIKRTNSGFDYMIIRATSSGDVLYERYLRRDLHKFDPYRIK